MVANCAIWHLINKFKKPEKHWDFLITCLLDLELAIYTEEAIISLSGNVDITHYPDNI